MKKISRGKMPHGGRFVHLKSPGSPQRLELNWYPRSSRFYKKYTRGEELDHLAFYVKNVNIAYEKLVRKGADAAVKPSEAKGTEVYVKDPDGIWIELLD
jgi:catechol 2,3-dioxygenase-like lactoylglutathione lyase family enzyme